MIRRIRGLSARQRSGPLFFCLVLAVLCAPSGAGAFDERTHGIAVLGHSFDTNDVIMAGGYWLNFRTYDRTTGFPGGQGPRTEDFSDNVRDEFAKYPGFKLSRGPIGFLDTFVGFKYENLTSVEYTVVELEPGEYILSSMEKHLTPYVFTTCAVTPVPAFQIAAGEVIYIGDLNMGLSPQLGTFSLQERTRNDAAARAALSESGIDPSKMVWRGLAELDVNNTGC